MAVYSAVHLEWIIQWSVSYYRSRINSLRDKSESCAALDKQCELYGLWW